MSTAPPTPPTVIDSGEVLDLLTALVQKSLVVYEEDEQGQGRYRLLETVRQYARDRLLEAGEGEAARDRHRDWFVALAERAAPHLKFGAEERAWMERLEREHDNLRAALEWCQASEAGREAGLRTAGALTWFWVKREHLAEGWQCVTGLLAAGSEVPVATRGKALVSAMIVARSRGDFAALGALAEEGLALGREAGDQWLTAVSLSAAARAAYFGGHPEQAQVLAEEGLDLAREIGDRSAMIDPLEVLAGVDGTRGDMERARTRHQEVLDLGRALEDTGVIAASLGTLGWYAWLEGNDEPAKALWSEALAVSRQVGNRSPTLYYTLRSLAALALDQGDPDTARAYLEEALAIARRLDHKGMMAGALLGLARVAEAQGDRQAVRALLEEAQTLDPDAHTWMDSGRLLLERGDYAAARSCYEHGLALRRESQDTRGIAWSLVEVGHAAWLQGEHGVTQSNAWEALALFQETEEKEGLMAVLESLGVAALAQGASGGPGSREAGERAARLFGAVEALRAALGLPGRYRYRYWWRRPRERMGEAVRAASLKEEFAAAWAEGRALSLADAIQYALEEGSDA